MKLKYITWLHLPSNLCSTTNSERNKECGYITKHLHIALNNKLIFYTAILHAPLAIIAKSSILLCEHEIVYF